MQDGYLRFPSLRALVGLSRTTIWRMERDGLFPNRRRLSENTVGWLKSEIDVWIAERRPSDSEAGAK